MMAVFLLGACGDKQTDAPAAPETPPASETGAVQDLQIVPGVARDLALFRAALLSDINYDCLLYTSPSPRDRG